MYNCIAAFIRIHNAFIYEIVHNSVDNCMLLMICNDFRTPMLALQLTLCTFSEKMRGIV